MKKLLYVLVSMLLWLIWPAAKWHLSIATSSPKSRYFVYANPRPAWHINKQISEALFNMLVSQTVWFQDAGKYIRHAIGQAYLYIHSIPEPLIRAIAKLAPEVTSNSETVGLWALVIGPFYIEHGWAEYMGEVSWTFVRMNINQMRTIDLYDWRNWMPDFGYALWKLWRLPRRIHSNLKWRGIGRWDFFEILKPLGSRATWVYHILIAPMEAPIRRQIMKGYKIAKKQGFEELWLSAALAQAELQNNLDFEMMEVFDNSIEY